MEDKDLEMPEAVEETAVQPETGKAMRDEPEKEKKVLNKITLFGALYLSVIAVAPIIISICSTSAANSGVYLGGTSVIIVVSVALETVRALEAQMIMRNYKGFLE